MVALSASERDSLLALARRAVAARVTGTVIPDAGDVRGRLGEPGAAFVSIHVGNRLRGCLGCIEPRLPGLAAVVATMAAAAASDDPRFPPLRPDELAEALLEISVLGPLIPIHGPHDIVVGRDGLVAECGVARGLLLPQVAVEWGWDTETFLDQTCRKAGLSPGAWRDEARLYRFEAEVFAEHSPGAPA